MKTSNLQTKDIQDLQIEAGELREKLFAYTVDAKMGKLKKIAEISKMKKQYARVQTAISHKALEGSDLETK